MRRIPRLRALLCLFASPLHASTPSPHFIYIPFIYVLYKKRPHEIQGLFKKTYTARNLASTLTWKLLAYHTIKRLMLARMFFFFIFIIFLRFWFSHFSSSKSRKISLPLRKTSFGRKEETILNVNFCSFRNVLDCYPGAPSLILFMYFFY